MFHWIRANPQEYDCSAWKNYFDIVARVRVRETGAAAPGARTAAPRIWACPAWVRQVVETCSRDNLNT